MVRVLSQPELEDRGASKALQAGRVWGLAV